jgi:hypothetical protein
MAIVTDAEDETAFLDQVSKTLGALADSSIHTGDWTFQFDYWLPQIVDICCKYRGYKNSVIEHKVLCSGSHDCLPVLEVEATYESGKVIINEKSMA